MNLVEQAVNELSDAKNLGDQVVTTLDVGLQQAASDALGDRRGAVVVMEPDTGKILAMVSKPGFDPNQLSSQWESLISGTILRHSFSIVPHRVCIHRDQPLRS